MEVPRSLTCTKTGIAITRRQERTAQAGKEPPFPERQSCSRGSLARKTPSEVQVTEFPVQPAGAKCCSETTQRSLSWSSRSWVGALSGLCTEGSVVLWSHRRKCVQRYQSHHGNPRHYLRARTRRPAVRTPGVGQTNELPEMERPASEMQEAVAGLAALFLSPVG